MCPLAPFRIFRKFANTFATQDEPQDTGVLDNKFEMVLLGETDQAWSKTVNEKTLEISWHCPFKRFLIVDPPVQK